MMGTTIDILKDRLASIGHPDIPALVLGMVKGRIMDRNLCIYEIAEQDLREIVDECWKTFDDLRPNQARQMARS